MLSGLNGPAFSYFNCSGNYRQTNRAVKISGRFPAPLAGGTNHRIFRRVLTPRLFSHRSCMLFQNNLLVRRQPRQGVDL